MTIDIAAKFSARMAALANERDQELAAAKAKEEAERKSKEAFTGFIRDFTTRSIDQGLPIRKEVTEHYLESYGYRAEERFLELAYSVLAHPAYGLTRSEGKLSFAGEATDIKGLYQALESRLGLVVTDQGWVNSLTASVIRGADKAQAVELARKANQPLPVPSELTPEDTQRLYQVLGHNPSYEAFM